MWGLHSEVSRQSILLAKPLFPGSPWDMGDVYYSQVRDTGPDSAMLFPDTTPQSEC